MKIKYGLACLVLLSSLGLIACEQEGPAEKAGKELDNAVEKAGESIEKAGEKIQDSAK